MSRTRPVTHLVRAFGPLVVTGLGSTLNFSIVPSTIGLLLQMPSWPLILPKGYQCLITCSTTIGDRSK